VATIPYRVEDQLSDLIYEARQREEAAKRSRRGISLARLGSSTIGHPCVRYVYLDWRAHARAPQVDGRVQAIFDTGHLLEARTLDDLGRAGLEVWAVDAKIGKQFEWLDETGHFVCKPDGVVKGLPWDPKTPHSLEIKSHNLKNFGAIAKEQSLAKANQGHYVQCQSGMWLSGLGKCLYVARCKNDERYYFETVVRNDKAIAWIADRVGSLYRTEVTPAGISADASAFLCTAYGGCDQRGPCLGGQPLKNCRTCQKCEPGPEGSWLCGLWEKSLTWDEQRAACEEYRPHTVGK